MRLRIENQQSSTHSGKKWHTLGIVLKNKHRKKWHTFGKKVAHIRNHIHLLLRIKNQQSGKYLTAVAVDQGLIQKDNSGATDQQW